MTRTTPRTVLSLKEMARADEKIAMLTCYDASFAALLTRAGVDVLLVGDSLGMVIEGHTSTLPVTLADMLHHTRAVATGAGTGGPLVVADMPFGSYQQGPQQAYASAAQLMAAGAQMVKLEGGRWLAPTVEFLVARSIPVCGHLGLTPQSVHALGGYKVQGRTEESAKRMVDDTRALVDAGIELLVLEMVPTTLATTLTIEITTPTIGIGAGPGCAGQVLVLYDMLDIYPGKMPRFVRNFMTGSDSIEAAVAAYVHAVKDGSFPTEAHAF